MAKIKFGAGIADARGHIGNMVFSKNGSGAYIKNKVTPVNPQTARQILVRQRLTTLAKTWATLTKGVQHAWKNFAEHHPITNQFGDPVKISGIAMFNRVNGVLLNNDIVVRTTPPPNSDIEALGTTVITVTAAVPPATNSEVELSSTIPDPVDANRSIEVWLTPPITNGQNNVNNLYKFAGLFPTGSTSADTFNLPISLRGMSTGDTIRARLFLINTQNGFKSGPQESDLTVI